MILEEILKEEWKNKCLTNRDDYIQQIADYFAYIILTKDKKEIDYSLDPSWDHSGRIVSSEEGFNLKDYQNFEEFINREYDGNSYASYASGCGLYHSTYEQTFDRMTVEWASEQLSLVNLKLIEEKNELLKEWVESRKNIIFNITKVDKITDIMLFEDQLGDFIYDFNWEIKDYVLDINPIILFNRGLKNAKKKIKKENIKVKQERQNNKINRQKSEKLWKVIASMYKLRYGQNLPDKINKPLYDNKFKDILFQCCKNGVNIKEIQNIADYLSFKFSNSVISLISNFNLKC